MIQDIRGSASSAATPSQTAQAAFDAQVDALLTASRSFGALDTRLLAQNVVDASRGDIGHAHSLSQAAGSRLSPVDQGSFDDFFKELIDAIKAVIEKVLGGATGTTPAPSGPTPSAPSGPAPSAPAPSAPALPPSAADSQSIPGLQRIANDPAVRSAIASAWTESNSNTPGAKQETGFWVVRDDRTGQLSTVAFPSNGTRDSLTPGPVPDIDGKTTVAFFHTHPNTRGEGYVSGPSPADQRFAAATGIPGIIRSHDGMYYFNP